MAWWTEIARVSNEWAVTIVAVVLSLAALGHVLLNRWAGRKSREEPSTTDVPSTGSRIRRWVPRVLKTLTPPLALVYLFLPGHPLTWLPGLPLNPLGLALLVLFGLLCWAAWPDRADWRRSIWIGRLGLLVVRVLKMLAVPLVALAILDAIVRTEVTARMGLRLIAICMVNVSVAFTIGLTLMNTLAPGEAWRGHIGELTAKTTTVVETPAGASLSPLDTLEGWIPKAIVEPLLARGWTPPAGQLVDWGCGSAIGARSLLAYAPDGAFDDVVLWDHSPVATTFAADGQSGMSAPTTATSPPCGTPATQCAAVRTMSGAMSVPPQRGASGVSARRSDTMKPYESNRAS